MPFDKQNLPYQEAKPVVKGLVALVMHLRHPAWTVDECFRYAQTWINAFEQNQ